MVQGIEALKAKLARYQAALQVELVGEMERQAAKVVADMKRLVPIDTGALRDSIGWTWGNAPAGSVTVGTIRRGRNKGMAYGQIIITIYAGTRDKSLGSADAFYARFQEFGTRKMPANPFFFPAWRANKTAVKAGLGRAIKRAAARVA